MDIVERALLDLAVALAQAGKWREARNIAFSIEDNKHCASALVRLANFLTQAGENTQAQTIWDKAEGVIFSIDGNEDRASALHLLANTLAHINKWQEAERIIRSIPTS